MTDPTLKPERKYKGRPLKDWVGVSINAKNVLGANWSGTVESVEGNTITGHVANEATGEVEPITVELWPDDLDDEEE
jgi:hypothetical protein